MSKFPRLLLGPRCLRVNYCQCREGGAGDPTNASLALDVTSISPLLSYRSPRRPSPKQRCYTQASSPRQPSGGDLLPGAEAGRIGEGGVERTASLSLSCPGPRAVWPKHPAPGPPASRLPGQGCFPLPLPAAPSRVTVCRALPRLVIQRSQRQGAAPGPRPAVSLPATSPWQAAPQSGILLPPVLPVTAQRNARQSRQPAQDNMSGTKYVDSEVGPPRGRNREAVSPPMPALPPSRRALSTCSRSAPPCSARPAATWPRRGAGERGSSAGRAGKRAPFGQRNQGSSAAPAAGPAPR